MPDTPATGYAVERRREGSALIADDRAFSDVPFPTNATVKQVALLLCDMLAGAEQPVVSAQAVRDAVSDLVVAHGRHWGRDVNELAQVTALAEAATDVLVACDLAQRADADGLRPRPLAAHFRAPTVKRAGGQP